MSTKKYKPFAKLFETGKWGQLLVTIGTTENEDGDDIPAITLRFKTDCLHAGEAKCNITFGLGRKAERAIKKLFDGVDEKFAVEWRDEIAEKLEKTTTDRERK
jgi:hypothetical protein